MVASVQTTDESMAALMELEPVTGQLQESSSFEKEQRKDPGVIVTRYEKTNHLLKCGRGK